MCTTISPLKLATSWTAFALLATQACAQETRTGFFYGLTGAVIFSGETDMGSSEQIQSTRTVLQGEIIKPKDPYNSIGADILIGRTQYTFGQSLGPDSDLDIDELQISVPIHFTVGQRGGAFVAPNISYAGENGVDFDEGATSGLIAGLAWQLSPNLMIGPGLGLQTTLQDDIDIFPFVVVDWKISDRWSLSTGSGFAASRGPGLRVAYQHNDTIEFGLEGRYEEFEFRLNKDHSVSNGYGTDSHTAVVLTGKYSPNERLTVTGFAGAALNGNISFTNQSGVEVSSKDYDTTPIFGVSARLKF